MSKKISTVIKYTLLLFGIGGIMGGLFGVEASSGKRIFFICTGVALCVISLVNSMRWVLASILSFGVGIAAISTIFDDRGRFDLAGLLTVLSCTAVGLYFRYKSFKHFNFKEKQNCIFKRRRNIFQMKSVIIFLVAFLLYHIIFSSFFPVDENNVLQAPDWYIYVGLAVSSAVTIFFSLKRKQSQGRIDKLPQNDDIGATLLAIDAMEGHRFEYWCADLLSNLGYTNVTVTQGSGDQGVDVLAQKDGIKYAIQCKCYSSNLGNTPIQEVNTGKVIYHCHVGVVMTNRYFTTGGKEAAEATGVLLWDRDWIASNLQKLAKLPAANSIENVPRSNSDYTESTPQPMVDLDSMEISRSAINISTSPLIQKLKNGPVDPLFSAAVDVIIEAEQASVSLIQRRLKLGYARAARIVDEMEDKGIVGPFQGSTPRNLLITPAQWELARSYISVRDDAINEDCSDTVDQGKQDSVDEQFIAEAQWYAASDK